MLERLSNEPAFGTKDYAVKMRGKRLSIMGLIGVPRGWVVDGSLSADIWLRLKDGCVPVCPGGFLGKRQAIDKVEEIKRKYGEAQWFILRDDETAQGWSGGPVLLDDLDPRRSLEDLLSETISQDPEWAAMKRRAYLVRTGHTETK